MKIQNPHDKAFKEIFDNDRVRELLQLSLPKKVSAYLEYNSMKKESDSFIDKI